MEMQISETSIVVLDIVHDGEAALREHIKNKTTALQRKEVMLLYTFCVAIHGYFSIIIP